MPKTNKNHRIFFFFLKWVLFAGVVYILYRQSAKIEDDAFENCSVKRWWALILSVILVVPNIYLAYFKWRVTMRMIIPEEGSRRTIVSFFAGIVTGIFTPNMIGNFLGRLYYYDREYRNKIIWFTMISNYAQLLATLIFGGVSVWTLKRFFLVGEHDIILWLLTGAILFATIAYFYFERWIKWMKRPGIAEVEQLLVKNTSYRLNILWLSLFRFLVFTLQFSLMLYAFGEPFSIDVILVIWQVYLLTILAPSLLLGKLGVKELIAFAVLGSIGMNELSVIVSSLIIWFVNTISPALLGLVICRRKGQYV